MNHGLYDKTTSKAVTNHAITAGLMAVLIFGIFPPATYLFFKSLTPPHYGVYWFAAGLITVWFLALAMAYGSIHKAFLYTLEKYSDKLHKANTKKNIEMHEVVLLLRFITIVLLLAYNIVFHLGGDPYLTGYFYIFAILFMAIDTVYIAGTNLVVIRPL